MLHLLLLCYFALLHTCIGQFTFDTLYDFELTTDVTYPVPGTDITLSCRRTDQYQNRLSSSFTSQDESISWELNGRSLLTTALDTQGRCLVSMDSGPGALGGNFGPSRGPRLPNVTCQDDGVTTKLNFLNWAPARLSGDTWRCLQFPFAESAKLDLQSFVPVVAVAIKQVIDRGGEFGPSRGTIVTCRSTPSRPSAAIDWFVQTSPETGYQLTSSPTLRESVDTNRKELSVTTSAILFASDDDHGKKVYCTSSNMGNAVPVMSTNITVLVKYPPTVSVFIEPSTSVLEGTDVSLHCDALGRPLPSLSWVKKNSGSNSNGNSREDTLVSLSPTFDLLSVTLMDSATYSCTAANGIQPNATASVVLYVREAAAPPHTPPSTLETGSASVVSDGKSSSSGAIAGGIIAALVVLVVIGVALYFFLKRRRRKRRFLDGLSSQRRLEESDGTYATCSTLPRTSTLPYPPYLEVLPPTGRDLKISTVSNPGYDFGDNIIEGRCKHESAISNYSKRPLPSTPTSDNHDNEYAYIDNPRALNRTLSANGSASSGMNIRPPGGCEVDYPYLKLQAVRTDSDSSIPSDAVAYDGYEIPVCSRQTSLQETRSSDPVSKNGKPQRARTVHTSTPTTDLNTQRRMQQQANNASQHRAFQTDHPTAAPRNSNKIINREDSVTTEDLEFDTAF